MRILYVGDDDRTATLVIAAICQHGVAEVVRARDTYEGLTALTCSRPDAVVVDLAEPISEGYRLLTFIKERIRVDPPMVVVIGTSRDFTEVVGQYALGVAHYIDDPDDIGAVVRVLGRSAEGAQCAM